MKIKLSYLIIFGLLFINNPPVRAEIKFANEVSSVPFAFLIPEDVKTRIDLVNNGLASFTNYVTNQIESPISDSSHFYFVNYNKKLNYVLENITIINLCRAKYIDGWNSSGQAIKVVGDLNVKSVSLNFKGETIGNKIITKTYKYKGGIYTFKQENEDISNFYNDLKDSEKKIIHKISGHLSQDQVRPIVNYYPNEKDYLTKTIYYSLCTLVGVATSGVAGIFYADVAVSLASGLAGQILTDSALYNMAQNFADKAYNENIRVGGDVMWMNYVNNDKNIEYG